MPEPICKTCGHPVSDHGMSGCLHLSDGKFCECEKSYPEVLADQKKPETQKQVSR